MNSDALRLFVKRHLLTISIVSLIIIFSLAYYLLDVFTDETHFNGLDDKSSYFDKLYLSIITQATIGFGDVTPASKMAKTLVMLQALSTIVVVLYIAPFTDTNLVHVLDSSFDDSLKQISGKTIKKFHPSKLVLN